MGMLFWLILPAYVLGVALRTPFSLRNRMLAVYCNQCNKAKRFCEVEWHKEGRYWHSNGKPENYYVVRGADRERQGKDAGAAILLASAWPVWVPFLIFRRVAWLAGQAVKRLVFYVTPLTEPELNRRLEQQRREIVRLHEKIDVPIKGELAVRRYPDPVVEYDAQ